VIALARPDKFIMKSVGKGRNNQNRECDSSIRRIALKAKRCGLAVLGLCLALWVSCAQREKIVAREIEFENAPAGTVRAMTFNIRYGTADDGENHWSLRKELVFDMLAGHAADVIGLQEVLDFQLKEMKRALPQYMAASSGRDDGKRAGEACSILYRADRFTLADSGTFWFSNTPWKPGSKHWGNELPRICTWVRLTEIEEGKSFYVYNLHLDHKSPNSRQYSLNLLAGQIAKRKHTDPVVVMGDFNMDVDDAAMAALGMTDVWQYLHPDQPSLTTYHDFGRKPNGPCVDHVLIDASAEIIEAAIDARTFGGRYPSDHFPLIVQMQLSGPKE